MQGPTSEFVYKLLKCDDSNQLVNCTEPNILVVGFIVLCVVALSLETEDEIIECDNSNESYCSILLYRCIIQVSDELLAPVVQRADSFIQRKTHCPTHKMYWLKYILSAG